MTLVNEHIEVTFTYLISDQLHARRVHENKVVMNGFFGRADKVMSALLALGTVALTVAGGIGFWTWLFPLLALELWFDIFSLGRLQTYVFCRLNPKLMGPYTMTFNDHGVHIVSPTIDSRVMWNHFTRLIESELAFLLYYGQSAYTVVPKTAFRHAGELDSFRRLVLSRISSCAG